MGSSHPIPEIQLCSQSRWEPGISLPPICSPSRVPKSELPLRTVGTWKLGCHVPTKSTPQVKSQNAANAAPLLLKACSVPSMQWPLRPSLTTENACRGYMHFLSNAPLYKTKTPNNKNQKKNLKCRVYPSTHPSVDPPMVE